MGDPALIRDREARVVQPAAPKRPEEETSFYNVPTSQATNVIMEVLGAGSDVSNLPARKAKYSRSSRISVMESGRMRRITADGPTSSVTLELSDIDKLVGSNKTAKKLFVLTAIKANEQAIHNGQLTKDYITFPLKDLIETGFYTTPQSARKGFNSGMDVLTSLKIRGSIMRGKTESRIDVLEVLFTGAKIEGGQCTVFLNPRISWKFLSQFYTVLPTYYFRLPNRASDLLYFIFFLARLHTKDIETKGYFTIGFRAIQQRLHLPSEVGNTRPAQTIKQPIEDALEVIEENHSEIYDNMEFTVEIHADDTAHISEYLDNGYLKVSLSGTFAQTFIEISKDTTRQIEAAKKRTDRITEKAIAINLAKKLEREDKPPAGDQVSLPLPH